MCPLVNERAEARRIAEAAASAAEEYAQGLDAAERERFLAKVRAVRREAENIRPGLPNALQENLEDLAQATDKASGKASDQSRVSRKEYCRAKKRCPHAGGHAAHNRCSDEAPPSYFYGCDVEVAGKRFDAINRAGMLYEIKLYNWSCYTEWLKTATLESLLAEALTDQAKAAECSYPFVFAVNDRELALTLGLALRGKVKVEYVNCMSF